MTDKPTLEDFGASRDRPPAPKVRREVIVQSPHTGKIAGFIGRDLKRDALAYTTLRRGHHYFYSEGGYAISDSILDGLWRQDVVYIYVHEGTEEDDVFEFTVRQYWGDGEAVPHEFLEDEDDPQTYVPLSDFKHQWHDHAGGLFLTSFDTAVDRINWRGYDPKLRKRKEKQQ